MFEVPVPPRKDGDALDAASAPVVDRYLALLARARVRLQGHTCWHINSTAEGGGVAELLRSCLGYLAGGGVETRWLVLEGDPGFFEITKRIHNRLHGGFGDGGSLGVVEAARYAAVIEREALAFLDVVRAGDVVVVHDPQPAGLIPWLSSRGAYVIWTCHVGVDVPNELCRSAWDFVRPFLLDANAVTFTRAAYIWDGLDAIRVVTIPPCIDAASPKNVRLDRRTVEAILSLSGVVPDSDRSSARGGPALKVDLGQDRSARIAHRAELVEEAPVPFDAPLVVQVSRWDRLKDPVGVIEGFANDGGAADAHLVLAGPAPSSVADDPEAVEVLAEVERAWERVRPEMRARVHVANLPTQDVLENAVIVNAVQRRADVIVQKSLAEGFGLTVTEAMWKELPLVASRVGGIQEQIVDGEDGLLVDPRDLLAFGGAVERLLTDRVEAARLAEGAHARVRERFLPPRYLGDYLQLFEELMSG